MVEALFFQPFLFFFLFLSKYRGANRAPKAIPSKRLASELLKLDLVPMPCSNRKVRSVLSFSVFVWSVPQGSLCTLVRAFVVGALLFKGPFPRRRRWVGGWDKGSRSACCCLGYF